MTERSRQLKRREFITLLGGAAAAWPLAAHGQQNRRPWRIAFPEEGGGFAGATKRFDAFRNGLRELGYTDDNSIIDRRVANGRDELIALCQNMITHGADVIVAGSSNLAFAAQEATKTVPIVIRAAADPVAARLVASLARPGGNITGVTSQAADLSAKRLELLKQLLPQLHRVAILFEPNAAASRDSMRGRVGAFDDLVNVRCSPLVQQREIGGDGYQAASRDSVPAAGHERQPVLCREVD